MGILTDVMTIRSSGRAAIRALFVDIDGTLVTSEDRISPGVQRALRAAQEKGCEVALCTGRTRYRIQAIAQQLPPPPGYAVTSNGGVVFHMGTQETIYRRLMPVPIALEVIRAIVEVGSEPYVFEDSDRPGIEGARVLFHPALPVGAWAEIPRYRPHLEIMDALPFEPVSVSAFGPPEIMRPLAKLFQERFANKLSIIQSGSEHTWGVEIYVANISKQVGLETVAARLEVDREEILAIGDHVNDIEMLQWAGIGVAMGNALPEIKAVADWVTDSVLQDGVARAIERYIL